MARESWSRRLLRRCVRAGTRRRTLAGFAALSVGDFFVPALPTQTAVIALALLQPARAVAIVVGFSLAAGCGALLMAALVAGLAGDASALVADAAPEAWQRARDLLRAHGAWIVFAASVFPTPPRLLVAAALLAGTPALAIAAAVAGGKATWFAAVVGLLVHAPRHLRRLPWFGRRLAELEALRADDGPTTAHEAGSR